LCDAAGFTLIEAMMAVAVAGVLAAVAYPAFQPHVIRTRRTEAQAALQALMQQQERYFTQHNRYIAFDADAADPEARLFRWYSGTSPAASAYEIRATACDGADIADCVQLIATPGTARVDVHFRDPACDTLILTSTGQRLAAGPAARCWR
jgi:type IV pilus assembly protein PilE